MGDSVNRLTIRDEGEGRISVLLRRAGQEESERAGEPFPFTFPLDAEAREDLRWYLEDYLLAPYAVWEDRGQAVADKLQGWGEALFQAVFGAGKPYGAYTRAREGAAELVIHSGSPDLLGLPWELLKDPERASPLALDPDIVAIDRTLGVTGAATEVPPGESLRVLMVIARPAGVADVGYQMIARPLLERLSAVRGRVDLEVLRPPTLEELAQRLKRAADDGRPYHVLHFDGHGVLQRGAGASAGSSSGGGSGAGFPRDRYASGGEGYVVFEKPTGGDDRVAAADLARIVRAGRVPLVVLNACQSGAMPEAAEAAVATRLLLEGAASVVAMGYSVYAVAAAEFMAAFYEALFEGRTVSAAVDSGRERLARRPGRPSPKGPLPLQDWMVPVHYRRRAIEFAQLRPVPARAGLSLDAALDQLRRAPAAAAEKPEADVHGEGSIEPVGRFVGRDTHLYTLELACRHDRVVLVHGPGGTGKTELAKAFARWWRDTGGLGDPGWVFFHSFEPGLPSFGLGGVINALGIRLFGADFIGRTEGPEHRRALILETLRQHRMLLIWDNVESMFSMPDPGSATPQLSPAQQGEIVRFLAELAAAGGASSLILTSRTTEDWLGPIRRETLGGLTPQEAAEYADDLLAPLPAAQERRKEKPFGDLMEHLAGHPLSLRLILPRLADAPAATLLAGLRGMGALPEGFQASAGRLESLGASVKYSLDHLPADVRRLLPAISLFEGVVDEDVLGWFSSQPEIPARFADQSKETWQAALAETARVGLLTPLWGGQYAIHPALPAYLAAQWRAEAGDDFEAEHHASRRALLAAHAGFGAWLNSQIEGGSAETAFALIDRQRRTMGELLAFALGEQRYAQAQAIMQPLNDFWDARGLGEEAKGWVDRVRAAVEGASGRAPEFDSDGGALWLFAVVSNANRANRAGDLAAAEAAYDDIRTTLEAAPPSDARDRRLAVFYHNLGAVAQDRGDLTAAENWYGKSLAIKEALGNRPGMATSYHQLGIVAQLSGDLAAAEDWYGKSLAIVEALGDRPGMARSYHQLGIVAQDRGDLAAAEDWYRKSLAIEEALGNRPGMAMSYGQLGIAAALRGDIATAEDRYRKALAIDEALRNRPGMALTYRNLGVLSEDRNNLPAALDWTVRAVALFDIFPHPSTGKGPRNLVRYTRQLGLPALEESWRRCTGAALPAAVRTYVEQHLRDDPA